MLIRRKSADIFCAVIDNFGDAGVCWRLAKRFTALGLKVRLIIDRPDVLQKLVPSLTLAGSEGEADGIAVVDWHALEKEAAPAPADIVIETFACRLPESFEKAIAKRVEENDNPPFYFNLDYLSAEKWVDGWHDIWGMHPTLPIKKLWFFPGFADQTGGVLIEDGYSAREAAFLESEKQSFLESLGADSALQTVFFFAYPANAVDRMAEALASLPAGEPINLLAAPGEAGVALAKRLAGMGERASHIRTLCAPFLPQADFDKLMWACDFVVVRGEDSFVRAQLAGKPMLWSTYPVEDRTHRIKLDAWLERISPFIEAEGGGELRLLFAKASRDWLEGTLESADFMRLFEQKNVLGKGMMRWRETLFARGDLARRMLKRTCE